MNEYKPRLRKTLCIIPARGGSKGIPRKNIRLLAGKPLIAYTIETAKKCPSIHKTIVTTDDAEIAEVASRFGAEVPFLRPKELADDNTPIMPVLRHAISFLEQRGEQYDTIVLLEPTSPLRSVDDVEQAIQKLADGDVDTVVGVSPFEIDFSDIMIPESGYIEPFIEQKEVTFRRQHTKDLIQLNGLVYAATRDIIMNPNTVILNPFGENKIRTKYVTIPKSRCLEIDEPLDFEFAEFMIRRQMNRTMTQYNGTTGGTRMNQSPQTPSMIKPRILAKSEEFWKRACKVTPAGTQCYSHGPTQFVGGASPKFIVRGKGCTVWDVDGNEYLDLTSGGYPSILGYAYEPVNDAVRKQMECGTLFPMMHPLEVEVAELLTETIPCAKVTRFAKNGSDVTAMAVRAARSFTKREKIACCGYHGIHDWYISTTTRNDGIPKFNSLLTHPFEYNNIESLKKIFDDNPGQIAGVIMEAVQLTPPKDGFLEKVKKLAHENGALLIFDEVITGFRFGMGGAQEYFGVVPDLACFGKSMSNGYPLSALTGREDIMRVFEKNTFFSSTYGGETTTLAAGKATINELRDRKVHPFLWQQGEKLKDGFNKIAREHGMHEHVECIGYPAWSVLSFKNSKEGTSFEKKSLFQQEGMKRGLLTGCYHGLGYAHKDEFIDRALAIYNDAMKIFAQHIEKTKQGENILKFIEGDIVKPVFRPVN